jgi:hypothetical protein
LLSRVECGKSWVLSPDRVTQNTMKMILRKKSNDWLARNQDNVFEWDLRHHQMVSQDYRAKRRVCILLI